MGVKNYDPKQIKVIFQGNILSGFGDGTFVSAKRTSDAFSTYVGADGEACRVKSADESGEVTITLQQASASNDILSAVASEDELTGVVTGPLLVKDLNGTTLIQSDAAWVKKLPDTEYGKESATREWVLGCNPLKMLVGGHLI